LLSLVAAVLGEFVVRRFEIAGDLIAVSGNIVVTLLLYDIFKPVNRSLSLLAASFNRARGRVTKHLKQCTCPP
jgi:hypothetical protein